MRSECAGDVWTSSGPVQAAANGGTTTGGRHAVEHEGRNDGMRGERLDELSVDSNLQLRDAAAAHEQVSDAQTEIAGEVVITGPALHQVGRHAVLAQGPRRDARRYDLQSLDRSCDVRPAEPVVPVATGRRGHDHPILHEDGEVTAGRRRRDTGHAGEVCRRPCGPVDERLEHPGPSRLRKRPSRDRHVHPEASPTASGSAHPANLPLSHFGGGRSVPDVTSRGVAGV